MSEIHLSLAVFAAGLAATLSVAWLGRMHGRRVGTTVLHDQRLNRWLVGLSAGATANSGFVVTGAVGLGYALGAQWLMLPVAWMLGDVLFWLVFPHRINRAGERTRASTITDIIAHGLDDGGRRAVKVVTGLVILVCLGGYVAAQWASGEKFLAGAFDLHGWVPLVMFAALVTTYTAIGDFRGSVYADTLQAVIRIAGTVVALAAVVIVASSHRMEVASNWAAAGPAFLNPFPQPSLWGAIGFVAGFAAAALGFGLGQPQIVTRYLAGASPQETRAAWWIYLGFVHATWLSMTLFGMLLRGVMPGIADPETGLSAFFRSEMGPLLTGLIAADVFATIAAATNGLLIALAQTVRHDVLAGRLDDQRSGLWPYAAALGALTLAAALLLHGSVFDLAIASASLIGAALAPVVAARVLGFRPPAWMIIASIVCGFATAAAWRFGGLGGVVNEALPGMLAATLLLAIWRFFANGVREIDEEAW